MHSKKCDRLEPSHANGLVHVFSTLHLINRVKKVEYDEEYLAWDSDDGLLGLSVNACIDLNNGPFGSNYMRCSVSYTLLFNTYVLVA